MNTYLRSDGMVYRGRPVLEPLAHFRGSLFETQAQNLLTQADAYRSRPPSLAHDDA